MAQRLILIDDLDESEGAETITYTVNGQDYEIDLSEENAQRFYDVLGPYIEKSRRVQRQPVPTSRRDGRRRSSGSGRDDIPQIGVGHFHHPHVRGHEKWSLRPRITSRSTATEH
jgi:hypothetical protein